VAEVSVVAYVDADKAALEALQAETGVPAALCFPSLSAALEAVECDAMLGVLRTDAHFAAVTEALEAGLHVLVEKPFMATLAEAQAANELAAKRKRLLAVSQNFRFFGAPFAIRDLLARRAVGKVDSATLDFRRHAPSIGFRYYDFPDPLVADMSIHHYDMMRLLFGEIASVSCRSWNVPDSRFRDDPSAVTTVVFDSGMVLSYRASFMSSGEMTPWGGIWAINGTEGEIRCAYRGDTGFVDRLTMRDLKDRLQAVPLAEPRYRDRAGSVHAFAQAVESGVMPDHLALGSDNIRSLAVVKACVLSARNGGEWISPQALLAGSAG
jgi:predicted dehydrogenase